MEYTLITYRQYYYKYSVERFKKLGFKFTETEYESFKTDFDFQPTINLNTLEELHTFIKEYGPVQIVDNEMRIDLEEK